MGRHSDGRVDERTGGRTSGSAGKRKKGRTGSQVGGCKASMLMQRRTHPSGSDGSWHTEQQPAQQANGLRGIEPGPVASNKQATGCVLMGVLTERSCSDGEGENRN